MRAVDRGVDRGVVLAQRRWAGGAHGLTIVGIILVLLPSNLEVLSHH